MSLWETIIGIAAGAAERSWRDKPRKDVINAFVALRNAMIKCQRYYDQVQEIRKQGDYDAVINERKQIAQKVGTNFVDPFRQWMSALNDFGNVLARVSCILEIFSPEVHQSIFRYGINEAENAHTTFDEARLADEDVIMDFAAAETTLAPSDRNLTSEIIQCDPSLSFKAAIEHLDAFMKANFKPEE